MQFHILKIVLWPRGLAKPRIVNFEPGVVNVISGASKTGKSAVIPIIDYCLGAEKCAIPVGMIRACCSWFGVVVQTDEGQKLFARREPLDQKGTNEMFVLEGVVVEVPERIEEKNSTVEAVKRQFDHLAGLPQLDLEPGGERTFKSRPSFRDLAAFNFQPQNIVANPGVLFFKADTTEHREKLKAIFPYVLNAISPGLLRLRHELDAAKEDLKRKELELQRTQRAADDWLREAQTWLLRAMKLGLSPPAQAPESIEAVVDALRIVAKSHSRIPPTPEQLDEVDRQVSELRRLERESASQLMLSQDRLSEIRRLRESGENFGGALKLQRDRLAIARWLRERVAANSPQAREVFRGSSLALEQLCEALGDVEAQAETYPIFSDGLGGELIKQKRSIARLSEELRKIRAQIDGIESGSEKRKREAADLLGIERFLGSLDQAIKLYDTTREGSALELEVALLKKKVAKLSKDVAEGAIQERIRLALDKLQQLTGKIIPKLDAEWKDDPIRLDIKELTVQIQRDGRSDYLWEVGSGANWLAYHVAMTIALQQYFLGFSRHPVPSLLVYDQPSQVYFPKADDLARSLGPEASGDIEAVRSVFRVLGEAVLLAEGRLQIIVLDHAHTNVWGNLPGVTLAASWWTADEKLVPDAWRTLPNVKDESADQ